MRAGPLKYRLRLLRPKTIVNTFGEEQQVYTPERIVHAERVQLSGRRSEEVKEHFADYTTTFRVRSVFNITEGYRVQQLGCSNLYTVVAVEPNLAKGMNTLICERLNE